MELSRWVLVSLIVVGCGGAGHGEEDQGSGGNDDSEAAGGHAEEKEFFAELIQSACRGLSECCDRAGQDMSRTRCELGVREALHQRGARHSDETTSFDLEAGERCIEEVTALMASCVGWVDSTPASCSQVFSGPAQAGEACLTEEDCAVPAGGKARCLLSPPDYLSSVCYVWRPGAALDSCQGTCQLVSGVEYCLPLPPGATTDQTFCFVEDGLRCGTTGTCVSRGAEGESCANLLECKSDLYCDYQTATCRPTLPLGSACDGTIPCQQGSMCSIDGWCREKLHDGEPCSRREDCIGLCTLDYRCAGEAASGWIGTFAATQEACNPTVTLR